MLSTERMESKKSSHIVERRSATATTTMLLGGAGHTIIPEERTEISRWEFLKDVPTERWGFFLYVALARLRSNARLFPSTISEYFCSS